MFATFRILREGDLFDLDGQTYIKFRMRWSRDIGIYNAKNRATGVYRHVLPHQKVEPLGIRWEHQRVPETGEWIIRNV